MPHDLHVNVVEIVLYMRYIGIRYCTYIENYKQRLCLSKTICSILRICVFPVCVFFCIFFSFIITLSRYKTAEIPGFTDTATITQYGKWTCKWWEYWECVGLKKVRIKVQVWNIRLVIVFFTISWFTKTSHSIENDGYWQSIFIYTNETHTHFFFNSLEKTLVFL